MEKRERAAQKMAAWQGSRAGAWPSWSLLHPSRLRLPTLCWLATWMRTPPVNKTPTPRWVVGKNEEREKMRAAVFGRGAPGAPVTATAPHRGPGGASPSGPLRISTCSGATSAWGWIAREQSDDAITAMAHGMENRCVRRDKTRRAGSRGGRGCAASCVNGGPTANWQRGNSTHAVVDGARASRGGPDWRTMRRWEGGGRWEVGGGFVDT